LILGLFLLLHCSGGCGRCRCLISLSRCIHKL
jgi:hypothetical protein